MSLLDEYKSIDICRRVANASTEFELNNSESKRIYLIYNILMFNKLCKYISSCCGTFGTGYPFYALNGDLYGKLPVIEEQIRYNNELIEAVNKTSYTEWCTECLLTNGKNMPDLKTICKPCPNMDDDLKPRRVINRLPDVDMWMISQDEFVGTSCHELEELLKKHGITTSDVDPVKTIMEFEEINEKLKDGKYVFNFLPFDSHIVDYSTIFSLIEETPYEMERAYRCGKVPYLPIHPLSLRKKWQYDDVPYNFIHDYLSSFTDFDFDPNLKNLLIQTRQRIAEEFDVDQLYEWEIKSGPEIVKRRNKTLELKKRFEERVNTWKE